MPIKDDLIKIIVKIITCLLEIMAVGNDYGNVECTEDEINMISYERSS